MTLPADETLTREQIQRLTKQEDKTLKQIRKSLSKEELAAADAFARKHPVILTRRDRVVSIEDAPYATELTAAPIRLLSIDHGESEDDEHPLDFMGAWWPNYLIDQPFTGSGTATATAACPLEDCDHYTSRDFERLAATYLSKLSRLHAGRMKLDGYEHAEIIDIQTRLEAGDDFSARLWRRALWSGHTAWGVKDGWAEQADHARLMGMTPRGWRKQQEKSAA